MSPSQKTISSRGRTHFVQLILVALVWLLLVAPGWVQASDDSNASVLLTVRTVGAWTVLLVAELEFDCTSSMYSTQDLILQVGESTLQPPSQIISRFHQRR